MKRLCPGDRLEITEWWRALSPTERRELRSVGRPPRGLVARFVEARVTNEGEDEPSVDFYEYLVNHEVTLEDGRKFHICSADEKARAVIAGGRIPATFACPRGDARCPMRALLDESRGHDLQLAVNA